MQNSKTSQNHSNSSTFRRFYNINARSKYKRIYSYYDKVSIDYNDRSIYIMDLGRYYNKYHYSIGISSDLNATEINYAKTFPIYSRIYNVPIGRYVNAWKDIMIILNNNTCDCPLLTFNYPGEFKFISFDNENDIYDILKILDAMLNTKKRFNDI